MEEQYKVVWLLAITLGVACLLGYLAHRLKQSPILGYLLAGFLIGPNSPGFVADPKISEELANIGVTLLMFAVGLNFGWKDLFALKKLVIPGAVLLSSTSIAFGMLLALQLGFDFYASLVVGLAICVSSTVVIARSLGDLDILKSRNGHIVMGWTIVEDVVSILGLLVLPVLAIGGQESSTVSLPLKFLWVGIKIGALYLLVRFLVEKAIISILHAVEKTQSQELFTLAILATAFFISVTSSYFFGVSLALGAFIAGNMIAQSELSPQASEKAQPMRDAFAALFFLSVGMLFHPQKVMENLPLLIGILAILLILRPLLAFTIVKLCKYPVATAMTVAFSISQIGEYSFILAEEGSQLKLLPDNVFEVIVAAAFITIFLNPFLFKIFALVVKAEERK